ncbi:MAG: biotin/lipoyl-containing protein [Bacteroidia bacterium]|nr:biotin/lipoyl-containing protein [Bacteroidia bacterium]
MKEFNYKINGAPYRVIVNNADGSIVDLEVNGTPYKVELGKKETKPLSKIRKQAITTPTPQTTTTPLVTRPKESAGKNTIQSPLPGIILDIRCNVGDVVKKGQTIMILEAMKMENNILSNANGKIAEILIQKGDSVLEGAELVIIE